MKVNLETQEESADSMAMEKVYAKYTLISAKKSAKTPPKMSDLDLTSYEKAKQWVIDNTDVDVYDEPEDDNEESRDHHNAYREQMDERISTYMDKYRQVMAKPTLVIYRAICVKKREDINFKKVGNWWSFEKDGVGCYGTDTKGKIIIVVTGEIHTKDIAWEDGFYSFIYYGEDQWECHVNSGAAVTITHIDDKKLPKPIKGIT